MKRVAHAHWSGTGAVGNGTLTTRSGALSELPYTFAGRFVSEDGTKGTNPEELIAAAHSGCYAMALSFALSAEGLSDINIDVQATVTVDKTDLGWTIMSSQLELSANVPGLSLSRLLELAEHAKQNCPVSRALASVTISLKIQEEPGTKETPA